MDHPSAQLALRVTPLVPRVVQSGRVLARRRRPAAVRLGRGPDNDPKNPRHAGSPRGTNLRMSRIAVIGAGYVGLTTGACFAHLGHDVVCADVVPDKIERL